MATTKGTKDDKGRTTYSARSTAPADFPTELDGEFGAIPTQTVANIGTIAGLAVVGGGYFGISVTDDGGSIRLAVRRGSFELDKRFYDLRKFDAALAYCLGKLR